MTPDPTARLLFRRMTDDDIESMCQLLGDPDVMRHYPHPKSRAEVQRWIDWTKNNYDEHGFGLWVIEERSTGDFVGDCGLTMQTVDGEQVLEVGYHVLPKHQGKGFATEAARACVAYGLDALGTGEVTAIIVPENTASRRVAEHLGMTVAKTTHNADGDPILIYSIGRPLN